MSTAPHTHVPSARSTGTNRPLRYRAIHLAVTGCSRLCAPGLLRFLCLALFGICLPAALPTSALVSGSNPPANQAIEYRVEAAKTIIELQEFRNSASIAAEGVGNRTGQATLIELNPQINTWFLLRLDWGGAPATYHLENPDPAGQHLRLDGGRPYGIQILSSNGSHVCDLWGGSTDTPLDRARRSALPYAPLCEGRLYLRNRVSGNQTHIEAVTDFLRDRVWGGDKIVSLVREQFYQDAFLEKGALGVGSASHSVVQVLRDRPRPPLLNAVYADRTVNPELLGIALSTSGGHPILGDWYPVDGLAGVYVSVIQPQAIATQVLDSYRDRVNRLDSVEANALDYLVAFDLAQFELGFALGTDHPRVSWSRRVLDEVRAQNLPGPDGIDTPAPLVLNGMVSPSLVTRTVAAFTGGFKRDHGAFHYGTFAHQNHGSHYGFVEQGTVLSKLQPGLASLLVLDDGSVEMKTWAMEDNRLLSRIKHARQNGVALIEPDATGLAVPGALVAQWAAGNWSGSDKENLRTLRAGACLQETTSKRFLIYGYFSTATPSAMARVFQSYGCRYAMHLDMNALEHTYLALYVRKGSEVVVEHLVEGMAEVDKKAGGGFIPRFLGFPDDRDFFYLIRREPSK